MACELKLDHLPLLPGAESLWHQGLESTLSPANRTAEYAMQVSQSHRTAPRYAALFDPQTSGGLILGVPADKVEPLIGTLAETTGVDAHCIGHVTGPTSEALD